MINTPRALALIATQILSFGAGYICCGFLEVLDAQSAIVPMGLVGMLALNSWAMFDFIHAEREEIIEAMLEQRQA